MMRAGPLACFAFVIYIYQGYPLSAFVISRISSVCLLVAVLPASLVQSVRAANVKALTEGTLLTLTRKDFDSLLGSLADIRHLWRFEALRMVWP